jgi:glycosyltransferase involved in cell wall biosynthesis
VRFRETWRGVTCHEVVNSPMLSPAAANFRNAERETACPALTAAVLRYLEERRAQLVHVHSLEGFGLDLIAGVRASGRPVVVTPHNYWYACPQVDLLFNERELCRDYLGGTRCASCLAADPPAVKKLKRLAAAAGERAFGPRQTELIRLKAKRVLARPDNAGSDEAPSRIRRNLLPDPSVALGHDTRGNEDGLFRHGFADGPVIEPAAPVPLALDENERFLAGRDVHLRIVSAHGHRRKAGVAALAAADLVTPPSAFNLELHAMLGVPRDRLRVVRYGQPHFDQINRRARRSPFYRSRPWDAAGATRPLRLGFFGTARPNKGLEVLVRAIPLLAHEVRRRCQVIIRAQGQDWPFRKRLAAYPEVSFLGGYDLLQLISAGGEYDVGLLPHIWFDNSPLVMWEHLHAGKAVIASRLGGAADTIRSLDEHERGNGLFFAAGRPEELARQITRVVTGEVTLPSPAEIHEVSQLQTYPGHVGEVDGIYKELLDRGGFGGRSEAALAGQL